MQIDHIPPAEEQLPKIPNFPTGEKGNELHGRASSRVQLRGA